MDKNIKKLKPEDFLNKSGGVTGPSSQASALLQHMKYELANSKKTETFVGNKKYNALKGIHIDNADKWFDNFMEKVDKKLKGNIEKVLELKTLAKKLNPKLQDSLNDINFKKWVIFEAATGCFKFSGKLTLPEALQSPQNASIADYMLVFNENGIDEGKSQKIDIKWAEKHSPQVKFNVSIKSSGGNLFERTST
jgi:hypothetical protein